MFLIPPLEIILISITRYEQEENKLETIVSNKGFFKKQDLLPSNCPN